MLWLYRVLFFPALLLMAPRYLWRMRRRGGYREKFSHRFGAHEGLPPKRAGVRRAWVQAVSVGEVLAIAPLLEKLVRAGGVEIYLTTTTSTGRRLALDRYRNLILGLGYFPLDWWWFSRRAWRQIDPDLVIITEGERWPEHAHQAARRGVPVLCINARLSDRSFQRLRMAGWARELVLGGVTKYLASSAPDAERLRSLGVPAERVTTTGNIKLDVEIARLTAGECAALRRDLGLGEGLVLLGSSTWPGEEMALLDAWRGVCAVGGACSLLIVPRHAERRPEVERLIRNAGATYHLRSHGAAPRPVDIAVGDTTGELRQFTQLADLVFIGKSLPPNEGGQTPVEAAALEKPMLFGPQMSNFRSIARELLASGAAVEVKDAVALAERVRALLPDAAKRAAMAAAAGRWQRENAGAVERTLAAIQAELGPLKR
jgi:3-deoxy-D-manno-octulosonic-acid transferase